MGKFVIELEYFDRGDYDVEFCYEVGDHLCYLTVYDHFHFERRKVIKFSMKDF